MAHLMPLGLEGEIPMVFFVDTRQFKGGDTGANHHFRSISVESSVGGMLMSQLGNRNVSSTFDEYTSLECRP